jgi:hypothetical protein
MARLKGGMGGASSSALREVQPGHASAQDSSRNLTTSALAVCAQSGPQWDTLRGNTPHAHRCSTQRVATSSSAASWWWWWWWWWWQAQHQQQQVSVHAIAAATTATAALVAAAAALDRPPAPLLPTVRLYHTHHTASHSTHPGVGTCSKAGSRQQAVAHVRQRDLRLPPLKAAAAPPGAPRAGSHDAKELLDYTSDHLSRHAAGVWTLQSAPATRCLWVVWGGSGVVVGVAHAEGYCTREPPRHTPSHSHKCHGPGASDCSAPGRRLGAAPDSAGCTAVCAARLPTGGRPDGAGHRTAAHAASGGHKSCCSAPHTRHTLIPLRVGAATLPRELIGRQRSGTLSQVW